MPGGVLRDGWKLMIPLDDELPSLHRAARHGDLEEVTRCLENGDDPNALAIVQRSDQAIERMRPDDLAESRLPVLHAAVEGGEIAVIRKLLDSGADPHLRWICESLGAVLLTVGDFGTALVLAARANRTDILTLLMDYGLSADADPEIRMELAEGKQVDALRFLIERSSLPVNRDALLQTALNHGAGEMVRLLLTYDSPSAQQSDSPSARTSPAPNLLTPAQRSHALYSAADAGHTETVRVLLEAGSSPEEIQEAFRIACRSRNSTQSVIRLLLKRGAAPRDNNVTSPELLAAVTLQKHNRAQLLLARGASVDGRYSYPYVDRRLFTEEFQQRHARPPAVYEQMTLLMLAAGQGAVSLCRLLLDHGAEPDDRDAEGYTALWYAVLERTGVPRLREVDPEERLPKIDLPGVIDLLLSRGADPDARDPHGRTPREWIREMRSEMEALYSPEYMRAVEAAFERGRGMTE